MIVSKKTELESFLQKNSYYIAYAIDETFKSIIGIKLINDKYTVVKNGTKIHELKDDFISFVKFTPDEQILFIHKENNQVVVRKNKNIIGKYEHVVASNKFPAYINNKLYFIAKKNGKYYIHVNGLETEIGHFIENSLIVKDDDYAVISLKNNIPTITFNGNDISAKNIVSTVAIVNHSPVWLESKSGNLYINGKTQTVKGNIYSPLMSANNTWYCVVGENKTSQYVLKNGNPLDIIKGRVIAPSISVSNNGQLGFAVFINGKIYIIIDNNVVGVYDKWIQGPIFSNNNKPAWIVLDKNKTHIYIDGAIENIYSMADYFTWGNDDTFAYFVIEDGKQFVVFNKNKLPHYERILPYTIKIIDGHVFYFAGNYDIGIAVDDSATESVEAPMEAGVFSFTDGKYVPIEHNNTYYHVDFNKITFIGRSKKGQEWYLYKIEAFYEDTKRL